MNATAWLTVAIMCEVIATTALKFTDSFTRLVPSVVVALGYGSAFYFLSQALRLQMPIGTAYALWSGIGTAALAILGVMFLGEPLNVQRVLGVLLVIGGVVVLNLGGAAH